MIPWLLINVLGIFPLLSVVIAANMSCKLKKVNSGPKLIVFWLWTKISTFSWTNSQHFLVRLHIVIVVTPIISFRFQNCRFMAFESHAERIVNFWSFHTNYGSVERERRDCQPCAAENFIIARKSLFQMKTWFFTWICGFWAENVNFCFKND